MTFQNKYPDRWERGSRLSEWIKKSLDKEFLGVTDMDGFYNCIRYTPKHRRTGILRFAFYEFKSKSPIMSPTQYRAFVALDSALRSSKHYAGFYLILYHAKFIDEADVLVGFTIHKGPFLEVDQHEGNLIVAGVQVVQNVSLKTVQAVCSLRADIP